MDDLLSDFIAETNESLERLDQDLVKLEQSPNDPDLLGNIFRVMHTVKGTCGFLGLPRLESVAHSGENILGKFRDGELAVNDEAISLILEATDIITEIVGVIAETGEEPEGDDSDLKKRIESYIESGGADRSVKDDPIKEDTVLKTPDLDEEIDFDPIPVSQPWSPNQDSDEETKKAAEIEEKAKKIKAELDAAQAKKKPKPEQENPGKPAKTEPVKAVQSVRINVDVLENLMTIVSELVLTRNQLLQVHRNSDKAGQNDEFQGPLQRLNLNVSELQDGVMQTRMQPVGNAWTKLPRIIRDLSKDLGKKIDLVMEGEDTELDRQVLELIQDPLTHMVRNSADHGIESPEERMAAGKPEKGTVKLSAFHQGGHIIIEIKDDGKGLNTERIKAKALENMVMTEDELENCSLNQIHNLIFAPGFSTAKEVTAVSGRGIGMDVVRTNIEKIGGTVDLTSVEGEGSTFRIKIPLTLAIVAALIVESGGQRFAIPQISVSELVRTNQGDNRIETIKGARVLRLRNRLLPLINLAELLKLKMPDLAEDDTVKIPEGDNIISIAEARKAKQNPYIIVLQVGAYSFGIIVDQVFDMEEIVVKPVAPIISDIDLFSGNTILGDGSIVMISDPNGIAKNSGDLTAVEEITAAQDNLTKTLVEEHRDEKTALLVFKAGGDTPKAVPLSLVGRLEEVDVQEIEIADDRPVIQYRDSLMPLIACHAHHQIPEKGRQPILVFHDEDKNKNMGLMIDEIVDIFEDKVNINTTQGTPGILGAAIIHNIATDIVDIHYYLDRTSGGDWFDVKKDGAFNNNNSQARVEKRVLLVDDSAFFREILVPILKMAGYDVVTAKNPKEALKIRDQGEHFDIIISDIEMPGMSGFDFAQMIKAEGKWKDTPMVALSSHATQKDMDHGRDVGFDDYVAKFDRDSLLESIEKSLFSKEASYDAS